MSTSLPIQFYTLSTNTLLIISPFTDFIGSYSIVNALSEYILMSHKIFNLADDQLPRHPRVKPLTCSAFGCSGGDDLDPTGSCRCLRASDLEGWVSMRSDRSLKINFFCLNFLSALVDSTLEYQLKTFKYVLLVHIAYDLPLSP